MEGLISSLKAEGVISNHIGNIMQQVDRINYCPTDPYMDMPQSIGYNATISAPHMHGYALQYAYERVKDAQRVLDVGSGSGYMSACFAIMYPNSQVLGIEHIPELVEASKKSLDKGNKTLHDRVTFILGDGRRGYPADSNEAIYDVIHVGAASLKPPPLLLKQLKPGGIMIIPLGNIMQDISVIHKDSAEEIKIESLLPVRYVPLTDKDVQIA